MSITEHLPFDSDLFGISVAKIVPSCLTSKDLSMILQQLKSQNVSLVYWSSDSTHTESQLAAKEQGGVLADRKVTYAMTLPKSQVLPKGIESYQEKMPNQELIDLALQVGLYSRFKMDPNITDDMRESMFKAWITNSTKRQIADEMLVTKDKDAISGMITLGQKNKRGDIGLIAVGEAYRGQSLGSKLVKAAQSYFIEKGFQESQVVTQMTNVSACKLYEKNGYKIESIEHFYHFWL